MTEPVVTPFCEPAVASGSAELPGDDALIARARQGDRAAFGELVRRHQAGVIGVVYRLCGDARLAEEAAQEAFLRAWQHLGSFKPGNSFRAWVYRIASNAALDELRRERPAVELDGVEGDAQAALPAAPDDPSATVEARDRAAQVRRAVMALPVHFRSVLVLREYGGLSYAEIAAALDLPLGTVMSRLNAARGQLRASLASLLEEK